MRQLSQQWDARQIAVSFVGNENMRPDNAIRDFPVECRSAAPDDAADCVALRGRTRENAISAGRLASLGITVESWAEDIRSGALPGFVCLSEGEMVGYCFGSKETGEVVVLALLPDFENQGIGSNLLNRMVTALKDHGRRRLFLGCSPDPKSRSYGFYRHLGWRSTGTFDKLGDEVLEYHVGALQRE